MSNSPYLQYEQPVNRYHSIDREISWHNVVLQITNKEKHSLNEENVELDIFISVCMLMSIDAACLLCLVTHHIFSVFSSIAYKRSPTNLYSEYLSAHLCISYF